MEILITINRIYSVDFKSPVGFQWPASLILPSGKFEVLTNSGYFYDGWLLLFFFFISSFSSDYLDALIDKYFLNLYNNSMLLQHLLVEYGCFESFIFRQNFVIFVRQITWFRWNSWHWTSDVNAQQKLQSICAVLTFDPQHKKIL